MPGNRSNGTQPASNGNGAAGVKPSGWAAVAQRQKVIEKAKAGGGKGPLYLDVKTKVMFKDQEYAFLQILNEEPICVEGAGIGENFNFYVSRKFADKSCPLIENKLKMTFKVVFKVLDYRGSYNKTTGNHDWDEPVERIWMIGMKVAQTLQTLKARRNIKLTDMVLDVTRSGATKDNTTYQIQQALDENNVPVKPIRGYKEKLPPLEEIMAPLSRKQLEAIIAGDDPDFEEAEISKVNTQPKRFGPPSRR